MVKYYVVLLFAGFILVSACMLPAKPETEYAPSTTSDPISPSLLQRFGADIHFGLATPEYVMAYVDQLINDCLANHWQIAAPPKKTSLPPKVTAQCDIITLQSDIKRILQSDQQITQWLLSNEHSLRLNISIATRLDITVYSHKNNNQRLYQIAGNLTYQDNAYDIDLQKIGADYWDKPAHQFTMIEKANGILTSQHRSLTVNETTTYTGTTHGVLLETNNKSINNSWSINQQHYAINNGQWHRVSVNRVPDKIEQWYAWGKIMRNRHYIGELTLSKNNTSAVLQVESTDGYVLTL